jgi:hypothetical protein
MYLDANDDGNRRPVLTDLVGDCIYQAAAIRYRVKGDTADNEVEIPGFASFFLVTEGEERGLIRSLEVFINNQPVLDRAQAMAQAK